MKNKLRITPMFLLIILLLLVACQESAESDIVAGDEAIFSKVIAPNLSNQRVMAFAEDAQGFMWIGTFRGLNRYTTHDFHQYFCTDKTEDLPDNQINHLFRDSKGRLWVATIWGIAFHNKQDKFTRTPFEGESVYCKQIFEGSDGRIYAITNGRLGCYDEEEGAFRVVVDNANQRRRDYAYGLAGAGGRIWLCGADGIIDIFDGERFALETTIDLSAPPSCFFHETETNRLLVGTFMGLKTVDIAQKKIVANSQNLQHFSQQIKSYISLIHRYDDSSLLFNTPEGLYLLNQTTGEIKHQDDNGFPFAVPEFVNSLFSDSHGNLWIGSYDQGFTIINVKERFNNNRYLVAKLRNKSVYSLAADNQDHLWIAILRGPLYMYNLKTDELTTIRFSPGEMSENSITSVFCDNDNNLWVASLFDGFVCQCTYDMGRLKIKRRYDITAPHTIRQDNNDNIWIGSGRGTVIRINASDGQTTEVALPAQEGSFVSGLQPMADGNIWVASLMSPLTALNPTTLAISSAGVDNEQWKASLRRSVFIPTDLYCDSYGELWIGTVGNGLLRYNATTGSLLRMEGLPCTDIASIREDRYGNIWVSSQYGLASYDRTADKFKRYFTADGIGGNQFYDRSACILPDGTMVFGGTNGVTIFNTIDVKKQNSSPLVFDELRIHNQAISSSDHNEVIDKALCLNPHINLNYQQNGFSISYASLNYGEQERANYTYRLEGHDKYWVEAGQTNEAYYANLSPGDYTFHVRITSTDSDRIENEIAIPITITPAPWLSWWAILGYMLIIAYVVYKSFKIRAEYRAERNQRQQAERDREQIRRLNTMNMSFLANISHEFRTPLTMISGPVAQLHESSNISVQERRLLTVIQRNVSRMLRLVNQLMDLNKLENDTIRLQVEHIDALTYLRLTIETFTVNADEKGIALKSSGLEESFVTWIDIDKMEKILSNILSNALKFTPPNGGQIDVDFDVIGADEAEQIATEAGFHLPYHLPCIKLTVTDNGPGIPTDQLNKIFDRYYQLQNQVEGAASWGSGIGLYYSRALATLHHGCLFAEKRRQKEDNDGARFTPLVPVGEEAYKAEERVVAAQQRTQTQQPLPEPTIESASQESDDEGSTDSYTLLIVDDDTEIIGYLKTLLSPYYTLLTAFNAESGIETATEQHPDLILSDVIMPGTDGYDFCRTIKSDIQLCHIPVILVTAKSTIENQVEGLNTGADAYVTKPFDPQYLIALIRSLLSNRLKARNILSQATETSGIEPDVLSGHDKAFMNELYQLMEADLSNSELDITSITDKMHISRTKLFYKIKGLTGSTPAVFFKTYKLNRAAELIAQGDYSMSEIADMTGFSTQAHFSTSFKKHFGVSPTSYHQQ